MTGRRKVLVGVSAAAVVALVLVVVGYFLFLRSDAPPRVSTEAALAACQQVDDEVDSLETADGTWAVSTRSADEIEDGSFVGYRVDEELTSIGANTAVGRTPDVSGSLELAGTVVRDVQFEADLTGLQSDDSRRDATVQSRALETGEFPTATFTLDGDLDLGAVPGDGEVVERAVAGSLTLHGVTNPLEVTVEAQIIGDVVVVTGGAEIVMTEFGITPPRFGPVVSVGDSGEVEFQLCLTRSS